MVRIFISIFSSRKIMPYLLFVVGWLILTNANSQDQIPLNIIDAVVDTVLSDIAENKSVYENDKQKLQYMVNQRIAPHFNFIRITQLAMGKNWSAANTDQQQRLAAAFQTLLVRSYASSLLDIPENAKQRYAFKSQQQINPERMVINLTVNRTHGDPVQLSLRLEQHNATWQVIDVVIDGVSMVISYRAQFDQKIRDAGIEGLITSVQSEW